MTREKKQREILCILTGQLKSIIGVVHFVSTMDFDYFKLGNSDNVSQFQSPLSAKKNIYMNHLTSI